MADDTAQGPKAADRYEVGELLGRGAVGEVRRAVDHRLRREVAIKSLRPGREGEADRSRFLHEAQVTSQLEHPGIVPVHDVGEADGRSWFAMKRIKGRSLGEAIATGEVADPARSLEIVLKVCDAVAFAHSRGVLHRDLKPDNVMIGEFGEVFVMDWGLARVHGEAHDDDLVATDRSEIGEHPTLHGRVAGTPAFMSPEQARGDLDRIDERSDVYSLGALLYALLTGRAPFEGPPLRILKQVIAGPPAPPSAHAEVPRELEAVVLKAMAREPERRFASVLELSDELRAWQAGRPLASVDYGPLERLGKFAGRHRVAVRAATLTGLLALVVLIGGLTRHVRALNEEQQRTQLESARAQDAERDARLQLANARVATADTRAGEGRFSEARRELLLARDAFDGLGASTLRADLGLSELARTSPPRLHAWTAHDEAIVAAAISDDGALAVTGSRDGTAKLWELPSGRLLAELPTHGRAVAVAFVDDVALVARQNGDHAEVVEITGAVRGRFGPLDGPRAALQLVDHGRRLAVHSRESLDAEVGDLAIWEVASGDLLVDRPVTATRVTLSPGGGRMVLRGPFREEGLSLVDVASGAVLGELSGRNVALSRDGRLVASAGARGVSLWATDPLRVLWTAPVTNVSEIGFTADERGVYSGLHEQAVSVWDVENGGLIRQLGVEHSVPTHVAQSSDGSSELVGWIDGRVEHWARPRRDRGAIDVSPGTLTYGVDASPDGRLALTGSEDGRIRLWDLRSSRLLREGLAHPAGARSVQFSADGTRALSSGRDGRFRQWDLRRWSPDDGLAPGDRRVTSARYLDDGRVLTTGSEGSLAVWEYSSGTEVLRLDEGAPGIWQSGAAGDLVAGSLISRKRSGVVVHDLATGETRYMTGYWHGAFGLAMSPTRLAAGDGIGITRVWDPRDGRPLHQLQTHSGATMGVALSPDGRLLATGGTDWRVRVWDLESGDELRTLEGHDDPVLGVTFAGDRTVLAVAADGRLSIWPLDLHERLEAAADDVEAARLADDAALIAAATARSLAANGQTRASLVRARQAAELGLPPHDVLIEGYLREEDDRAAAAIEAARAAGAVGDVYADIVLAALAAGP